MKSRARQIRELLQQKEKLEQKLDKLRRAEEHREAVLDARRSGVIDPEHPWRARNKALRGTFNPQRPAPVRVLVQNGKPLTPEGKKLVDWTEPAPSKILPERAAWILPWETVEEAKLRLEAELDSACN